MPDSRSKYKRRSSSPANQLPQDEDEVGESSGPPRAAWTVTTRVVALIVEERNPSCRPRSRELLVKPRPVDVREPACVHERSGLRVLILTGVAVIDVTLRHRGDAREDVWQPPRVPCVASCGEERRQSQSPAAIVAVGRDSGCQPVPWRDRRGIVSARAVERRDPVVILHGQDRIPTETRSCHLSRRASSHVQPRLITAATMTFAAGRAADGIAGPLPGCAAAAAVVVAATDRRACRRSPMPRDPSSGRSAPSAVR